MEAVQEQRRAPRYPSPVIVAIRATPVNLPLVAPYRWVAGLNFGFTNVIVEVETDTGIVGVGEAGNWRHAQLISSEIGPRLIGRQADDLHGCWDAAVPPVETLQAIEGFDVIRAFGAIEMALWDIRAKAAEVPLYRLLGGAVRTRVPFTEYFAPRPQVRGSGGEESPEEIAAYCERMISEYGSPYFEGKVGYSDLDTDIELATLVREAIGPKANPCAGREHGVVADHRTTGAAPTRAARCHQRRGSCSDSRRDGAPATAQHHPVLHTRARPRFRSTPSGT